MLIPVTWNAKDVKQIWKEQRVPNGANRRRRAEILQKHYEKFHNVPLAAIQDLLDIQRNNKHRHQFSETYDAAQYDENSTVHGSPIEPLPLNNSTKPPLQSHRTLTGKLLASNAAIAQLQAAKQQLSQQLQSTMQQLREQRALVQRHAASNRNLQQSLFAERENHRNSMRTMQIESNQRVKQLQKEHRKEVQDLKANHKKAMDQIHSKKSQLSIHCRTTTASLESTSSTRSRMLFNSFLKLRNHSHCSTAQPSD